MLWQRPGGFRIGLRESILRRSRADRCSEGLLLDLLEKGSEFSCGGQFLDERPNWDQSRKWVRNKATVHGQVQKRKCQTG